MRLAQATILLIVMTLLSGIASAYVVKKGDSFSKIIGVNVAGPVFGRKGNFDRILKLNPQIKIPALILPRTEVLLTYPLTTITEEKREVTSETETIESPPTFPVSLEFNPYYLLSSLSIYDKSSGDKATLASQLHLGSNFSYFQNGHKRFQTFLQQNSSINQQNESGVFPAVRFFIPERQNL